MRVLIPFSFALPIALLLTVILKAQEAEASWNDLAGTWTDRGSAWEGILPNVGDAVWHYGPARLWSIPVNSANYVITSRVYIQGGHGCGHVFKYKTGSVRTQSHVTKAWGYFLWSNSYMYITSSGGESSPRISFPVSTGKWYTQKSVVDGTNVKIYIDKKMVKEITMSGEGADSTTDNYVGLWCHARTRVKGDSFKVPQASVSCPRPSLSSGVTASPSSCRGSDSPVGTACSFSCVRGYRLMGTPSINCTSNGAWTDQSAYVTCVEINECLTDNGGCSHSCTNAPGAYRCTCPDPELSLGVDNHTCKADGVTVNCGKNDMSITLPKSLLRGLDRHHLRLLNTSCQATETSSHYTLTTPLTGCGTTSRHTKAAVVYTNKLIEMPVSQRKDIITRVREIEIPFHCYYANDGGVSAVGLEPSSKKLVFSENAHGNFSLSLDMFPDGRFTASFSNDDFPVGVVLRRRLYFQVSVTSADNQLSIMADRCFATPTQDSNGPTQYEFINRGCPKDDTVKFHSPPSTHKQRFSVEAFKFIADHPFVFVHCHVKICNATNPNSGCVRKCSSRGRRAAADQVPSDGNPLYSLAQGPLVLDENNENEPASRFGSNGSSAGLQTMLALLCVVCLAATAYMAVKMKRRGRHQGYSLLHEES